MIAQVYPVQVADDVTLYRTPATNEGNAAARMVRLPAPVDVDVTQLTEPSAMLSKVSVTAVLIGNVPKLILAKHRFISWVSVHPPQS